MAVNNSRNMRAELELGLVEGTYMQLAPMRGGEIENYNEERLEWPTYAQVEKQQGGFKG